MVGSAAGISGFEESGLFLMIFRVAFEHGGYADRIEMTFLRCPRYFFSRAESIRGTLMIPAELLVRVMPGHHELMLMLLLLFVVKIIEFELGRRFLG